jgi:hypothetical protein
MSSGSIYWMGLNKRGWVDGKNSKFAVSFFEENKRWGFLVATILIFYLFRYMRGILFFEDRQNSSFMKKISVVKKR